MQIYILPPYYLHLACNTNLVFAPVVLRGDAFTANNKIGFLDGSICRPPETSYDYGLWAQLNSMLTAWLQNTLEASNCSTVPLT